MSNNKDFTGNLTIYRYIDSGAVSNVYECDYKEAYFAYKMIVNAKYARLIDKNINNLCEFYGDSDMLFPYKIIYDRISKEVLEGYIMDYLYKYKKLSKITEEDKIKILLRARDLIEKLHNKYNYVHTDIAPHNFMYNKDLDKIVLIDFDGAINLKDKEYFDLGFYNMYTADYIEQRGVDKDLDVFLFNLCCYSVLKDINYNDVLNYILNKKDLGISDKASSILKSYSDLGSKHLKKEYIIDYL